MVLKECLSSEDCSRLKYSNSTSKLLQRVAFSAGLALTSGAHQANATIQIVPPSISTERCLEKYRKIIYDIPDTRIKKEIADFCWARSSYLPDLGHIVKKREEVKHKREVTQNRGKDICRTRDGDSIVIHNCDQPL